MYNFRLYIILIRVPFGARQNSYGFKNLVKLGTENFFFKITIGTRVFEKSCSTSPFLTGNRPFSKKILLNLQIESKRASTLVTKQIKQIKQI